MGAWRARSIGASEASVVADQQPGQILKRLNHVFSSGVVKLVSREAARAHGQGRDFSASRRDTVPCRVTDQHGSSSSHLVQRRVDEVWRGLAVICVVAAGPCIDDVLTLDQIEEFLNVASRSGRRERDDGSSLFEGDEEIVCMRQGRDVLTARGGRRGRRVGRSRGYPRHRESAVGVGRGRGPPGGAVRCGGGTRVQIHLGGNGSGDGRRLERGRRGVANRSGAGSGTAVRLRSSHHPPPDTKRSRHGSRHERPRHGRRRLHRLPPRRCAAGTSLDDGHGARPALHGRQPLEPRSARRRSTPALRPGRRGRCRRWSTDWSPTPTR